MAKCILRSDDEIVNRNLSKMTSNEEGGMIKLLNRESMGISCNQKAPDKKVGINFYYDSGTGDIVYFGVIGDVPEEIRFNYDNGIFGIATSLFRGSKIETTYLYGLTSEEAKRKIEKSRRLWNHWSSIRDKEFIDAILR